MVATKNARVERTARGRPASAPSTGNRAGAFLVVALLALGIALRLGFATVRVRSFDEYYYTRYASWIIDHVEDLPSLVRKYNQNPVAWQYPSPTRIGHLWLVYGLVAATGDASVPGVARLSIAASIAALLMTAGLAWARFGPWVAAMAVAFLACSPLDLAISRRAWQDAVLAAFTLAAAVAYARALARPPRAAWWGAFFALGAYAVLLKESAVAILGLGAVGLAWVSWRERRRRNDAWPPLAIALGALILALAVQALACGGATQLVRVYARIFRSGAANKYMHDYQMGGPGLYALGLGILQPLPFLLGPLAALLVAARVRFVLAPWQGATRDLLVSLAWLVIVLGGAALVYTQKNMRFLSPIYAPTFVLAGALVWATLERLRARAPRAVWRAAVALVVLGLAGSAALEVQRFRHFYVEREIPDLATPWLLEKPPR